jgi:hypothetical protein
VVDCCGDGSEYTKWFPLLPPSAAADSQQIDGDGSKGLYPWTSEKDRYAHT